MLSTIFSNIRGWIIRYDSNALRVTIGHYCANLWLNLDLVNPSCLSTLFPDLLIPRKAWQRCTRSPNASRVICHLLCSFANCRWCFCMWEIAISFSVQNKDPVIFFWIVIYKISISLCSASFSHLSMEATIKDSTICIAESSL